MRKRLLNLCAVLCFAGGIANAAPVQNYVYSFDEEIDTSVSGFHPLGWFHNVDNGSYTWNAEGGVTGGSLTCYQYTIGIWEDMLISPPYTGSASIYVKALSDDASVEFFNVGAKVSDNKYDVTKISDFIIPTLTPGEWVKVDLPIGTGHRVGMKFNKVEIDDFSAASCDITAYQELSIRDISRQTYGTLYGDPDNRFQVEYKITLQNKGEVSYAPGDRNYTLSHYLPQFEKSIGEIGLPEPIEAGETKEMTVNVTLEVSDEAFEAQPLSVTENISGSSKNFGVISYKPYKPELAILIPGSQKEFISTGILWSDPYVPHFNFGISDTAESKSYKITIKNTAPAATLTLTGVEFSGSDFVTDLLNPVTLGAGESKDITITLTNPGSGIYREEMMIKSAQLPDVKAFVSAFVPDEVQWHEGFEQSVNPAGFIVSEQWKHNNVPYPFSRDGHKMCVGVTSTSGEIITPKLKVAEGETLVIGGNNNEYGTASFTVSYSSDRSDWTEVYNTSTASVTNKFSADSNSSGRMLMGFVEVNDIPEGNWYFRIEGNYANIDDIYGFERVQGDEGLIMRSSDLPLSGMVNKPYVATVEIINLGSAVSADSYSIDLCMDDEVLCSAESVDLEEGALHTFTLSAIPHEAGEYDATLRLTMGKKVSETDPVRIVITEEVAVSGNIIVGTQSGSGSMGGIYIMGYGEKNSLTETLYPRSYIEKYTQSLAAGAKIGSVTYYGKFSTSAPVEPNVKVYLKNESAQKLNADYYPLFSDPTTMTKVYEGPVVIQSQTGGELYTISFDQPFEYTGDGIDIMVETTWEKAPYSSLYYWSERISSNGCTAYTIDYPFPSTGNQSSNIPTIGFGLAASTAIVSGVVTDEETAGPLSDVRIILESEDHIIYKGVTDESGQYNINVLQADKPYKVKGSKDTHDDYESGEYLTLSSPSVTHHFTMKSKVSTGVESASSDSLTFYGEEGCIVLTSESETTVAIYDISGRPVTRIEGFSGKKSIAVASGLYIVNNKKICVR